MVTEFLCVIVVLCLFHIMSLILCQVCELPYGSHLHPPRIWTGPAFIYSGLLRHYYFIKYQNLLTWLFGCTPARYPESGGEFLISGFKTPANLQFTQTRLVFPQRFKSFNPQCIFRRMNPSVVVLFFVFGFFKVKYRSTRICLAKEF